MMDQCALNVVPTICLKLKHIPRLHASLAVLQTVFGTNLILPARYATTLSCPQRPEPNALKKAFYYAHFIKIQIPVSLALKITI